MKPPPQEPTCDCCGAPIPALRWDGTYKPIIDSLHCSWCRQPFRPGDLYWANEDRNRILESMPDYARFIEPGRGLLFLTVYGVRVGA